MRAEQIKLNKKIRSHTGVGVTGGMETGVWRVLAEVSLSSNGVWRVLVEVSLCTVGVWTVLAGVSLPLGS